MTDWSRRCCPSLHESREFAVVEEDKVGRPQSSAMEGPQSDSLRVNTTPQDGVGLVVTRPLGTHHGCDCRDCSVCKSCEWNSREEEVMKENNFDLRVCSSRNDCDNGFTVHRLVFLWCTVPNAHIIIEQQETAHTHVNDYLTRSCHPPSCLLVAVVVLVVVVV